MTKSGETMQIRANRRRHIGGHWAILLAAATALAAVEAAAQHQAPSPVGAYRLTVEGLRGATTGMLDVVGTPGDYFGRLALEGERPREFAVGLASWNADSMRFTMGGNGEMVLYRAGEKWSGRFQYFRLTATLSVTHRGPADPELMALAEPAPLARGVVSTAAQETFPTTSPDGMELYFTRDGTILVSRHDGDSWASPDTAAFSGEFDDSAPFFSPDGQTLLFTSNRPNPDQPLTQDQRPKKNLWRVDRLGDQGWSAPYPYPAPVNVDTLGEYHGALARGGVIYFVSYNRPGGFGRSDLYRGEPVAEGYRVENLGPVVNTAASEADVYVDPDERFILLVATDLPGSFGADDIYVSYRQGEGWTQPRNLGPAVNSFAYEYAPWIDRREGVLYFTSFRRGSADLYRIPLDAIALDLTP